MLKNEQIEFSMTEHEPLFTVQDSKLLRGRIEGGHSKNLFLKDQKDNFFLVTFIEDITADLKKLPEALNSKRLSFAKTEYLKSLMGIEPGSVSPFGLINDTQKEINFYFDEDFLKFEIANFHPLVNTATVSISPKKLISFIEKYHKTVNMIDMSEFQK
jgi:Ala-tRNA(Pro) deacylase